MHIHQAVINHRAGVVMGGVLWHIGHEIRAAAPCSAGYYATSDTCRSGYESPFVRGTLPLNCAFKNNYCRQGIKGGIE